VNYLLDTNVISEWQKPSPSPRVVDWLTEVDEDRVYLSVVTLAELRLGVDLMPEGRKKSRLDEWLRADLPLRFEERVLAIDVAVANAWGMIVARLRRTGRQIAPMDALLAATAQIHGLVLVTRNTPDFTDAGITLLNPWDGE
jgi:predicted nucleic acid-binding protein